MYSPSSPNILCCFCDQKHTQPKFPGYGENAMSVVRPITRQVCVKSNKAIDHSKDHQQDLKHGNSQLRHVGGTKKYSSMEQKIGYSDRYSDDDLYEDRYHSSE